MHLQKDDGGAIRGRGIQVCRWAAIGLLLLASPRPGGCDEPPAVEATPFQAGDISIGEPIALPFDNQAANRATPAPATAAPPSTNPSPAASSLSPAAAAPLPGGFGRTEPTSPAAVPGSGWLGIVVAESSIPGRFAVAEVAAEGPAAAGGILAGDEVRAINGMPLRTSDEVAQALTAIAPGQQVRLAIARGEQVGDMTLQAIPRPAPRGWAAAGLPAAADEPPSPAAAVELPPPAAIFQRSAVAAETDRRQAPELYTGPRTAVPEAAVEPARSRAAAADPVTAPPAAGGRGRTALGVRTVPIDPGIQARFRLPEASGAYVIGVVGDLPASRAGVPPGSVIVALDDRPVRSPTELTRLVTAGPIGTPVPLEYILPGGAQRRAEVVLQTLEQPLEAALVGGAEPQATEVPPLQPQPPVTTARRPSGALDQPTAESMHSEIRRLQIRLESLERRLEAAGR